MTSPLSPSSNSSAHTLGTCSLFYVIFISAVAAIGGFLFGFDSGVINGTVSALGNAFNSSSVATSVLAPAYIAEVAPPALRGRLATLQQLAIVLGLFAAFLSNYLIADAAGSAQNILMLDIAAWRWMFWAELVPAILFLVGVLFIPESPRYLVAQGKVDDAKTVFSKISNDNVAEQISDVKSSLRSDKKPSIRDLFIDGSKKVHPIVWAGVALSVFQQFVGINVVFYYGSELWQAAGFDESQSLFINVLAGTTNIVSTFIAIALVDKIGRKPLLLVGSIGMFISLSALTYIFGSAGLDEAGKLALSDNMGTFALIMANLFVVFFGLSWGPVVWVLLGEMFNNRIRGAALAVAASSQWIANFAITMTFPIMLANIGLAGAYGFYALSALISIFFVAKYITETRGKTLESM